MSHPTSTQLDRSDLHKLKVLAAMNHVRIGDQLAAMIDDDLRCYSPARIKSVLGNDPDLLNAVLEICPL